MFNLLQNDDTPMIILNGGHEAFIQQLEKFGPS